MELNTYFGNAAIQFINANLTMIAIILIGSALFFFGRSLYRAYNHYEESGKIRFRPVAWFFALMICVFAVINVSRSVNSYRLDVNDPHRSRDIEYRKPKPEIIMEREQDRIRRNLPDTKKDFERKKREYDKENKY